MNKIKLLEARQEVAETIRGFERRLAYACNFTTKCEPVLYQSQPETILLPVLVRGLDDIDAQAEIIAFIAIREADAVAAKAKTPAQTANSNITLKHDRTNTKDSTNPEAQDATSLKLTPPSPIPPEQVENGTAWASTSGSMPRKRRRAVQKWSRSHLPETLSNPAEIGVRKYSEAIENGAGGPFGVGRRTEKCH